MTDANKPGVNATQTSASGQKVDATGQSDATRQAAAQAATGGAPANAPKDTTASKGGSATTGSATTGAATTGAKAKGAKAEGEGGRGRKSQYSGMRLKATVAANARREGSHGHKSLQILLDAGKDGILYEDYVKKGGRLNDLVWDINKDHVVATKA